MIFGRVVIILILVIIVFWLIGGLMRGRGSNTKTTNTAKNSRPRS
jgi:flagellar biogenesis protein FliO